MAGAGDPAHPAGQAGPAHQRLTFNSLRGALAEILASFPVYRTYVAAGEASTEDVRTVDRAVGLAKQRSQAAETSIYDFVRDVLLARHGQGRGGAYQDEVAAFAMKFQQYSGPVMAKGMEDTTFYQYNRLVSLNEVGSTQASSACLRTHSTRETRTGRAAGRTPCWRAPPTTASARRMCAPASARCPRSRANGSARFRAGAS